MTKNCQSTLLIGEHTRPACRVRHLADASVTLQHRSLYLAQDTSHHTDVLCKMQRNSTQVARAPQLLINHQAMLKEVSSPLPSPPILTAPQIRQIHKLQRGHVTRLQHHLRCSSVPESILPPRHTQAPLVTRLQTGEVMLLYRSAEVIPLSLGVLQKFPGHDRTHGVQSTVF